MRRIRRSSRFKRDFKRVASGPRGKADVEALQAALTMLVADVPLPQKLRDHALTGRWADFRDLHLRPDLVLIYAKTDDEVLLARLGSHSELGL